MGGVLVLDDNTERMALFRNGFAAVPLLIVSNAGDAICSLQRGAYDVLFLDHEHAACNGTIVAAWISEHCKFVPALTTCTYIIHCTASTAAKRIGGILRRAHLRSFVCPSAWNQPTLIAGLAGQIRKKAKNSLA